MNPPLFYKWLYGKMFLRMKSPIKSLVPHVHGHWLLKDRQLAVDTRGRFEEFVIR